MERNLIESLTNYLLRHDPITCQNYALQRQFIYGQLAIAPSQLGGNLARIQFDGGDGV
jgi:hypothetical protein